LAGPKILEMTNAQARMTMNAEMMRSYAPLLISAPYTS